MSEDIKFGFITSSNNQSGSYDVAFIGDPNVDRKEYALPIKAVSSIHKNHQYFPGQGVGVAIINESAMIITHGWTRSNKRRSGDQGSYPVMPMLYHLGNKGRTCWAEGCKSPNIPLGDGKVFFSFKNGEEPGLFDGQYLYGNKAVYEFPVIKKVRNCPTIYNDLNSGGNLANSNSNIIYQLTYNSFSKISYRRRLNLTGNILTLVKDDYQFDSVGKTTYDFDSEKPVGFTIKNIGLMDSEDRPAYCIFYKNYTTPPPRPVFVDQQLAYSGKFWSSNISGFFPFPLINGAAVTAFTQSFPSGTYTRTRQTPNGYVSRYGLYIEQTETVRGTGATIGENFLEHRRLLSTDGGNTWEQVGDYLYYSDTSNFENFEIFPSSNWVGASTKPFASFANNKIWTLKQNKTTGTSDYYHSNIIPIDLESFELGDDLGLNSNEISNVNFRIMANPQPIGGGVFTDIVNSSIIYRLRNYAYQNINGYDEMTFDFASITAGVQQGLSKNYSLLTDDNILFFVYEDRVAHKIGVIGFDITKPEEGALYNYIQDVDLVEGERQYPETQKLYCYGQYLAFNAGDAWKIIK